MAKQTGLGAGFLIGGYDLSGDVGSLSRIASPRAVLDVTPIDKFAFERLLALKDGAIDFLSFFNPSTAHPALSTLPRTDVVATYLHRKSTQGTVTASMVGKQINYDGNREQSGAYTFNINAVANGFGLEWGELLTEGITVHTAADSDASVDDGAATAFGLQAYLNLVAFTGTNITVAIQSSSDNGAGDAFANVSGGVFTQLTGVGSERIQTARNAAIERYLRVATTGTFTSATFAVTYVRNEVTVNF